MNVINENARLELKCPICDTKFTNTIREMTSQDFKCPKCGVAFDTSQFKKDMQEVEKTIKDFGRKLKNL